MSQPSPYRKLPGRGMRREGTFIMSVSAHRSALWLGADHMLLVDSTIASQDLKRFYFRDIQAITVRKTHTGRTVNIVLAVLIAGTCSIIFGVNDTAGRIALLVIAGFFGTFLLVNSLLGPTCETHLQTAVQRELLPSLGRLRNARKVLRILRPLLEQTQGQISTEDARARATTLTAAPAASVAHTRVKPAPQLRPLRTSFHTVLFSLLLLDGLLNAAAVFLNSMPLALVQLAGFFGVVGTLVGALIRQQDTDITAGLRRVGQCLIGYISVLLVAGFVVGIVHTVQNPSVQNELAAMKYYSSLNPFEHPWLLAWFVTTSLCSSVLGITGTVLLSRYRRSRPAAAATPTPAVPPRLPAAPMPLPLPATELAPPLPPPAAPPAPPAPPLPPPPPAHG